MPPQIHGLPPQSTSSYPAHFDIFKVIRPNILKLHPYRCARDDYKEGVLLDANENALGHSIAHNPPSASETTDIQTFLQMELNRYPDPSHDEIKERIAALRSVSGKPSLKKENIFLGVGSDEVIDLLFRVCVTPGKEGVLITPPTYGMYAVCAAINDVEVIKCDLALSPEAEGSEKGRFELRLEDMKKTLLAHPNIKLVMLCSPGNPTGTLIPLDSVKSLLEFDGWGGIVVVDEAYIDFAPGGTSATELVHQYSNLVVMQTLSKGFGLAAIRLGIAIAQPPLIQVLTNTKAPYNISTPTAHLALAALSPSSLEGMRSKVNTILTSRKALEASLVSNTFVDLGVGAPIGGGHANFLVVPILTTDGSRKPDSGRAQKVYKRLAEYMGVVVRYRGNEAGCGGCLRITVGTEQEISILLKNLEHALKEES